MSVEPPGNGVARQVDRASFDRWQADLLRWLLLATVYGLLAWYLLARYPTTGDEPHYWIHGHSLIHDFDQALANNYRASPFAVGPQMPHAFAAADDWWPFRGHGVALIAAPGTLSGQIGLSMLSMCALIAALWLPLFAYVRREIGPGWASEWLCLAFALGLPFATAAGRLFPDLPSGMLTAIAVAQLASFLRQPSTMLALGFGLAVAALPVVYWRHLPMVGLLLTLWLTANWMRGSVGPGLWHSRAAYALGLPLLSACAGLLYAFAYGPVDAARAAGFARLASFDEVVGTVFGHLLDCTNGLLWQQPLWWIVLVAIGWQLRQGPLLAIAVLLVMAAVLLPPAMALMYYGGAGLAGRYNWGYAAIGLVVLAPFLAAHRRWLWPVNFIAVALLLTMALRVLDPANGAVLEASNANPVWLRSHLYGPLAALMPVFVLDGQDLQQVATRAAMTAAALCLLGGWVLAGGGRIVPLGLTLALLIWAGLAPRLGHNLPTLHNLALSSIPSHGLLDDGRIERAADDDLKPLIFGPYLSPQPGRYRIHLSYFSADPQAVLRVSPVAAPRPDDPRLRTVALPPGYGILSLNLTIERAWDRGEIVLAPAGPGHIVVYGLAIERDPTQGLPNGIARPYRPPRNEPGSDQIMVDDFDQPLRHPQRVDWQHWQVDVTWSPP